ncbi:MAG: PTS sugar transporter subunit IIA, partial [Tissierellia bacterium]|nr:PTS sugar transporter subunit IIA [Tissierellia bacterium]
ICRRLELHGTIDKNYKQSVLDRENFGSTALKSGAAIPHGNIEFVKKTCVYFYISKTPIIWDNDRVYIIILISINREDKKYIKNILRSILELVENSKNIMDLKNCKDTLSIIRYIEGVLND